MEFYEILQKDPAVIKQCIRQSRDRREIFRLMTGMALRAVLIVVFAIIFISPMTGLFGEQNSAMAVVIFCILLAVRFVDFGYRIQDALLNLTAVFMILLTAPVAASVSGVLLRFVIHFAGFFAILFFTCDRPEMGNGGLYSFAYIFLSGNPVTGSPLFARFLMTCVGIAVCGAIFFMKHKEKHRDVTFGQKVREFSLQSRRHLWQLRAALGVSLILTITSALQLPRFMWAGFACGAMLTDYGDKNGFREKFSRRIAGVIGGSLLFAAVYTVVPETLHAVIAPVGGVCLGFCTDYRYKTAMNCFGALTIATGLYGLNASVGLRIADNLIGVLFAAGFVFLFEKLTEKIK